MKVEVTNAADELFLENMMQLVLTGTEEELLQATEDLSRWRKEEGR